MTLYALPVGFALLLWWFSTGAIFFLDTRPSRTFGWSLGGVTLLAGGAVYGVIVTSGHATPGGAYAGFTFGLTIWGWLETAFYMGFMVGPRRTAPSRRAAGWTHFSEAIGTTLYHELAALALAAVIAAICWDMPNKVALWTFLLLWIMQLSAKLNVFLGVPNLAEEFLPKHLAFLCHYMTRKPMNLFFPAAVTLGLIATTLLGVAAASASTSFEAIALTMLTALLTLAVVEHWFLVVPFRVDVLWRWSISPAARRSDDVGEAGLEHDPVQRRSGEPLASRAPSAGSASTSLLHIGSFGVDGELAVASGMPNSLLSSAFAAEPSLTQPAAP